MKKLLLFTGSFPFSAASENTFLPQEIGELAKCFDVIQVIPVSNSGAHEDLVLPNVEVNENYANFIRDKKKLFWAKIRALISPEFWWEAGKFIVRYPRNFSTLRYLAFFYAQARLTVEWLKNEVEKKITAGDKVVLETWWCDFTSFGMASYASARKNVVSVSRVHGYDLYEQRRSPAFIPFRRKTLRLLDLVFADSTAGAWYLRTRYPEFAKKVLVGLIGIYRPERLTPRSNDGVFRIVSCSFLIQLKRVDLLIRGLGKVLEKSPGIKIEWVHIGSGPEKAKLVDLACAVLGPGFPCRFLDYPGKEQVERFYQDQSVDLFVNLSTTEGTPVSIMEAISHGVPVLATAVGGNKEIVDSSNGLLVGENPEENEVADAILSFVLGRLDCDQLRKGSLAKWDASHNAEKVYKEFCRQVLNSLNEKKALVGPTR